MRKKIEMSKIILVFCDIITSISLIMVFWLKYIGLELSDVAPVFTALIGLSATAHGFYYWKAKAENTLKISKNAKDMGLDIKEGSDIDG